MSLLPEQPLYLRKRIPGQPIQYRTYLVGTVSSEYCLAWRNKHKIRIPLPLQPNMTIRVNTDYWEVSTQPYSVHQGQVRQLLDQLEAVYLIIPSTQDKGEFTHELLQFLAEQQARIHLPVLD
ncbi:hypothetical protein CLV58_109212 [Spirosoma oryzae]|uniref:Uncharacterized protein n=1 Tax=Spirosoma oryzae TaxID=1469603 RepID=A0A2T0SYK0_9BACT|nr:hypothetical protein [Spirosoma oryzae]PRY38485.1 hypothetical protein CLV58_109212 [Spirosoma oryzae]